MELIKVPPQNLEAEQAVLGAMMLDPEAGSSVFEILQPDDFYRDNHRLIFSAIQDLSEKGDPVDLVSVAEVLRRQGRLEQVGGIATISEIARSVPSAANVEYYAKLVTEKALLRQLIRATSSILERGYEPGEEARSLLEEAEKLILDLSRRRVKDGFSIIRDVLLETFEKIEYLYAHKGNLTGVPTFFTELDRMTSGWQPSDLVIIAARPSMGKTALVLNMAQNAAVRAKVPVAVFSLEMSKEQLVQRMLCGEAMVDQQRVRTGDLLDADWPKLTRAVGPLSDAPIFIDDTVGISLAELRSKARRLKTEHNLGMIIIDYLQLLSVGKKSESRQQEVAQISRSLKGLARELKVPVIALSQLNRGVEQRQDKRPMMSDLLESGAIEADADVISFIYRDDYYHPESEKKGIAELIIAKHRNGPVGTVELGFLREFTKFVNLDRQHQSA
ncbi:MULTISPECIES: replicative DNA helicase [Desulfosporosinus]|uniref:Replicative DNA helicase n=2 Tax=Desulfosporosinus TaxID=79206 RepID=A0A1M5Q3I7_9FIRM|nr:MULTISPECIES: replicative DNA helicase [Desulfosporosinus]MDA8221827.1 replicative DNA helicase [Desulfitobacterium hafniense]MCB8818644.1 replicative DNA helicase [Desulfosporosinus sp. SRJS8]MCO1601451.1 replicative DNA helicase [Desulfosporosinus nitroreducens]MDO0824031.1 replicative DNA helicase [Desulfosporosinus nitroreducens]SHH08654.1 replicative DNA helicase [Desulfosporosinus lacus DSM 15449]